MKHLFALFALLIVLALPIAPPTPTDHCADWGPDPYPIPSLCSDN